MENKKWSEDFIAFIGNETGVLQQNLKKALDKWQGSAFEKEKHLIELVNAKYPNGWYCVAFEEVLDDIKNQLTKEDLKYWRKINEYVGYVKCKNFNGFDGWDSKDNSFIKTNTKITKAEYLELTGRIPITEKINYNDVDFKNEIGSTYRLFLCEDGRYGVIGSPTCFYTQNEVEEYLSKGYWTEITEPKKTDWTPNVKEWCIYRDNDFCVIEEQLNLSMYKVMTLSDQTHQSCTIDDLSKWIPKENELIEVSNDGEKWSLAEYKGIEGESFLSVFIGNNFVMRYKFIRPKNWTGVKYRHSTLNYHGDIIREEGIFYLIYIKEENKNIHITKKNVNHNFSSGTWIELKEEPAKESILEEKVIIITIKDDDINLKATNIRPHELIGAMEMMLIRYKNKNLKL